MNATIERKTNIGRWAAVARADGMGRVLYGTVMDTVSETDDPKRVRLQRGDPELAGTVVDLLDKEYRFCWWADEEED